MARLRSPGALLGGQADPQSGSRVGALPLMPGITGRGTNQTVPGLDPTLGPQPRNAGPEGGPPAPSQSAPTRPAAPQPVAGATPIGPIPFEPMPSADPAMMAQPKMRAPGAGSYAGGTGGGEGDPVAAIIQQLLSRRG